MLLHTLLGLCREQGDRVGDTRHGPRGDTDGKPRRRSLLQLESASPPSPLPSSASAAAAMAVAPRAAACARVTSVFWCSGLSTTSPVSRPSARISTTSAMSSMSSALYFAALPLYRRRPAGMQRGVRRAAAGTSGVLPPLPPRGAGLAPGVSVPLCSRGTAARGMQCGGSITMQQGSLSLSEPAAGLRGCPIGEAAADAAPRRLGPPRGVGLLLWDNPKAAVACFAAAAAISATAASDGAGPC
jgi:hypothetical protein